MPEPKVGVKLEIDVKQALSATEAYLAALKRIENATNRFAAQSARTSLSLGKGLNQAIGAINQQTNVLVGELRSLQQTMGTTTVAQDGLTRSVGRGSASWVKHAKKMALWAVGAASAYRMFMKIRRALEEMFKELYENTEEYKRLAAAADKVKISLLTVLGTESDILRFLDKAAGFANDLADGFAQLVAVIYGLDAFSKAVDTSGDLTEAAAIALQKYNDVLATYSKNVLKASEDTKDYSKAIDKLVSIAQRWAEAQEEFSERQRKASETHLLNMRDIHKDYWAKIQDAEDKYQDAIGDANTKAAKAREKAWKKYYIRIKQIQKRAQRDVQKLIDQHNLRRKHAKQSYDLSMLQSERLYQYQRGMLVAEGDVLAIEDLDARYELEKQAREENYELQRQQAEAMFQLQLKYQKEANRDMIVALRASLQERLAEIEAQRRERLAEAEDERAEEKADADDWRKEEIADEEDKHQKQLEANAKYLEDVKKQTAEGLAKIALEHDLSAEQISAIATKLLGADGELVRLTTEAMNEQVRLITLARNAWDEATAAVQRYIGAISTVGTVGGSYPGGGGSREYRQYGGDDIISTPTWLMVGEAGPERVSVQPLSPIGGALSLGWSGGPIPVHGSGEFSNADLSGIGDAIAQGIVLTMRDQVLSYRGQRGY